MSTERRSRRLLPFEKLAELVPYTRQHIGRLERLGQFPPRVQVGPGRVAWVEGEVDAWLESRIAARGER